MFGAFRSVSWAQMLACHWVLQTVVRGGMGSQIDRAIDKQTRDWIGGWICIVHPIVMPTEDHENQSRKTILNEYF